MLEKGVSGQFTKISKNKFTLIDKIVQNDNIIRYSIDLGRVDIDGIEVNKKVRRNFMKDNMLLDYFTHDVKNNNIVYFVITPFRGHLDRTHAMMTNQYVISILCPAQYWFIEQKMIERPMVIAEEIAKMIDQQRIMGIGEPKITEWRTFRLNDDFAGLDLTLTVSERSVKM